jgi:hypothetical protein
LETVFYDVYYTKMAELLSALLGFFFTVTILLVLFDNCSFNMGCGGKYATQAARWPYSMERMANYGPEPEVAMEEVGAVDSPVANDSVEGFASVDASGTGVPMKHHTGILNPMPDNAAPYSSHPFGAMVREGEPYGSSTPGNTNCVITCAGGPGKHY